MENNYSLLQIYVDTRTRVANYGQTFEASLRASAWLQQIYK